MKQSNRAHVQIYHLLFTKLHIIFHYIYKVILLKEEILHQLRWVVYPIIYRFFFTSKRWLFGISSTAMPATVDPCLLQLTHDPSETGETFVTLR